MIIPGEREPIDYARVRTLLEAQRRELTEHLHLRVARIRDSDAGSALAKEPDAGNETDLDVSLLEIVHSELKRVDSAIARLDSGQYGWCTRCDGRIAAPRLRAMPFALCCRDCEMARERETAQSVLARNRPWDFSISPDREEA